MILCHEYGFTFFHHRLLSCIERHANEEAKSFLQNEDHVGDMVDNKGLTLLHHSAKHHNVEMVKYLIGIGSNVNAQDSSGATPLILAIKNIKISMAMETIQELLKNKADIFLEDYDGQSSLLLIIETWTSERISLNMQSQPYLTMFVNKINEDFLNDKTKVTRLMITADYLEKLIVVVFCNMQLSRILLKTCYPVNFQESTHGYTALHLAILFSKIEVIKMLFEYGADAGFLNNNNQSPLYYYYTTDFHRIDKNLEIFIYLVKSSSSLNLPMPIFDNYSDIEYIFITKPREFLMKVLQSGIDISKSFISGRSCLHILIRNENITVADIKSNVTVNPEIINAFDSRGVTPLMTALKHFNMEKVQYLIKKGAFVSAEALKIVMDQTYPANSEKERQHIKIIEQLLNSSRKMNLLYINSLNENSLLGFDEKFTTKIVLAHSALNDTYNIMEWIHMKLERYPNDNNNKLYTNLSAYYDSCKGEIDEMKKIEVQRKVTLYEILSDEGDIIFANIRSRSFILALNDEIRNIFALDLYYCDVLQRRIDKAMELIEISEKAALVVEKLTGICHDTYYLIVGKIICHLEFRDLENLCKLEEIVF